MDLPLTSPSEQIRRAARDRHPTRGEFGRLVHDALEHVYDPVYLQTHPLARFVRAEREQAPSRSRAPSLGRAFGQTLLDAVEALRPGGERQEAARSTSYQILRLRFVDGLEVSAIQDRLAIGRTSYFVEQRHAIEAVASYLWDAWQLEETSGPEEAQRPRPIPHPAASERPRHNLPLQLTSFVGREREMAEVRRLLGQTRLLTLTGTGGCGKTRLALQVAADLVDEYPDGVWLVELASLADPSLVTQTIASALGVREKPDQPILQTLQAHLVPRRLLLVLDNCEHLVESCASTAAGLLRACPKLQVLATSRELLSTDGELIWHVPSLSVPDQDRPTSVERLLDSDAVRLFVERAALVQVGFRATAENAPCLAQIVRRLDGLPLAIELAAARARALSVEEISEHLDDRFRLLAKGSRAAPPRHQTLRATIDWSYDLLSEPERALLRRLAVFAGGWTIEGARAVCAGGAVSPERVLDLLLQLVDKSLVLSDVGHEPSRYRLLETVRQFSLERLGESVEVESARDRHLAWYLDLAEQGAPALFGPEQGAWLQRLEREHDNLRAALEWALTRDGDADRAIRLGAALGDFWLRGEHESEARSWLGRVLALRGGEPSARLRVLASAMTAEGHSGNYQRTWECCQQSLVIATETGDKRLIAGALLSAGYVPFDFGEWAAAREVQEQALVVARESGDARTIADILHHLWASEALLGNFASARRYTEEALALSESLGDLEQISLSLSQLGSLCLMEGDVDRARALGETALDQARSASSIWTEAFNLRLLGDVARAVGDYATAEAYYREMLAAWTRVRGNRLYTTSFLASAAGIDLVLGRVGRALRLFGAVHGWLEAMGIPVPWMQSLHYQPDLETVRTALGDEALARAYAEGRTMTLEQAVEYALGGEAQASPEQTSP